MAAVTIKVREVGQCFAHCAEVRDETDRLLHTTREVPYGMIGAAYTLAHEWVETHGHTMADGTI